MGVIEAIIVLAAVIAVFRLFGANRDLEARLRALSAELHDRLDRVDARQEQAARAISDLQQHTGVVPPVGAPPQPAPPVEPGPADDLAKAVEAAREASVSEPAPSAEPEPVLASEGAPVEPVAPPPPPPEPKQRFEWERFIGLRLPIWLGAIALCIAGFFFVSYAIDSGFFTPEMRVLSAAAAALAFLAGAEFVRRRVKTGNPAAIASALGAASIATAYATVYLATKVYNLAPSGTGFIATVAVSLVAIAIALAYGQIVALVGIIGGYVAPMVFGGGTPSAAFLTVYLMALTAVSFAAIRFKSWWRLSIVGLLGPTLWILIWPLSQELARESYWSGAFFIALPLIVTLASWNGWREDGDVIGFRGFTGAMTPQRGALVAAVIVAAVAFALLTLFGPYATALGYWQGFIVYGLLAVALGFVSPPHRALQLPILIVGSVALLLWPATDDTSTFVVIGMLALVFGFGALDQFRRLREPALWASVLSFVALWLLAMALFKITSWPSALEHKHYWALGALALAAAFVGLLSAFGPRIATEIDRSRVYAIWGGTVTTLVSLAVVLEIDPLYFPAAAAVAILGLSAVHLRVPVRGLRVLAVVYLVIYGFLLFASWAGAAPTGAAVYFTATGFEDHGLILLVLPGLALIIAATLFQRGAAKAAAGLIAALDVVGVVVLALGLGYLLIPQHELFGVQDTLVLGSRVAAAEMLLAAVAIYLGRRGDRPAAYGAGAILSALVSLAMLGAMVGPIYIFWPGFSVPGPIVFNITLLAYAAPALILFGIGWYLRQDARRGVAGLGIAQSVLAVVMIYTLMLVDIRQGWHQGAATLVGPTSQSEFYAYSIGTLAFGLILLVIGVAFRNRSARALSFVFVLAATLKVFLWDAAALEGLWRVLSFLLMGLAFLGISWAYARFVFGIGAPKPTQVDPAQR